MNDKTKNDIAAKLRQLDVDLHHISNAAVRGEVHPENVIDCRLVVQALISQVLAPADFGDDVPELPLF